MKNIQIKNSYNIWDTKEMQRRICEKCREQYHSDYPEMLLNRTYNSMYTEWWLHNIGYYLTKPLYSIEFFKKINIRCKDVDINEWYF